MNDEQTQNAIDRAIAAALEGTALSALPRGALRSLVVAAASAVCDDAIEKVERK